VEELEAALGAAGPERPRFWVLGFGEGREVPAAAPGEQQAAP
jgi:hypothetical protein